MCSQWESEKLLQGLVSDELTAYLPVFDVFLTQWIMAILPKECKPFDHSHFTIVSIKQNFEKHKSLREVSGSQTQF